MHATTTTPLRAVALGALAGAAGTAAMTAWQELSAKLTSSSQDAGSPQPATEEEAWEQASVPAKLGRRIAEGVLGVDGLSADRIGLVTNVMHWGYGTTWGVVYGVVQGSLRRPWLRTGALFGTAVWAASYAELVPLGLYAPPWTYAPGDLALDWSYHLAFGTGTAVAHRVLAGV
jgi:hypothetical protein